jgi:hypothetical protein
MVFLVFLPFQALITEKWLLSVRVQFFLQAALSAWGRAFGEETLPHPLVQAFYL